MTNSKDVRKLKKKRKKGKKKIAFVPNRKDRVYVFDMFSYCLKK